MRPGWQGEVRLAFQLLSRLPAGQLRNPVPPLSASAWAWPIVGVAVGAIAAAALHFGYWLSLPPAMAAILALGAGILATGALHEDGLADVADGFGGGATRARKLEIMRDSRIGSYGVIALALALGFRALGIAEIAQSGSGIAALIGLAAASRATLPAALVLMAPARSDGLGHAAAGHSAPAAAIAAAIGLACLLPLGPGVAVTVAIAMALSAVGIAALAQRQIGGQTGDVMGAMQQVSECAGWAALVALL